MKEGEGMYFDEDECPACGKKLSKEIEQVKDGFIYIFKCGNHGIMRKRDPTFKEAREWNS